MRNNIFLISILYSCISLSSCRPNSSGNNQPEQIEVLFYQPNLANKVGAFEQVNFSTKGEVYYKHASVGIGGPTASVYDNIPYKLFSTSQQNPIHVNGYTYQNVEVPPSGTGWYVYLTLKYESCGYLINGKNVSVQKGGKVEYSSETTIYTYPQNIVIQKERFYQYKTYECP